eukprot:TRINITY_DN2705_c0_g2_i1.p1 TRINITY_DN2705_c0_g2~~TRINITY_DN2705_c0_g2_i1.p1  ORF type:complete len:717 (+),score=161.12 TRINITY_DN2705_c0_g2_i1:314-2464(+)
MINDAVDFVAGIRNTPPTEPLIRKQSAPLVSIDFVERDAALRLLALHDDGNLVVYLFDPSGNTWRVAEKVELRASGGRTAVVSGGVSSSVLFWCEAEKGSGMRSGIYTRRVAIHASGSESIFTASDPSVLASVIEGAVHVTAASGGAIAIRVDFSGALLMWAPRYSCAKLVAVTERSIAMATHPMTGDALALLSDGRVIVLLASTITDGAPLIKELCTLPAEHLRTVTTEADTSGIRLLVTCDVIGLTYSSSVKLFSLRGGVYLGETQLPHSWRGSGPGSGSDGVWTGLSPIVTSGIWAAAGGMFQLTVPPVHQLASILAKASYPLHAAALCEAWGLGSYAAKYRVEAATQARGRLKDDKELDALVSKLGTPALALHTVQHPQHQQRLVEHISRIVKQERCQDVLANTLQPLLRDYMQTLNNTMPAEAPQDDDRQRSITAGWQLEILASDNPMKALEIAEAELAAAMAEQAANLASPQAGSRREPDELHEFELVCRLMDLYCVERLAPFVKEQEKLGSEFGSRSMAGRCIQALPPLGEDCTIARLVARASVLADAGRTTDAVRLYLRHTSHVPDAWARAIKLATERQRYEGEDQAAFLALLHHSLQNGGTGLNDVWALAPRSMTVPTMISELQHGLPPAATAPAFINADTNIAEAESGYRITVEDVREQLLRMLSSATHTPRKPSGAAESAMWPRSRTTSVSRPLSMSKMLNVGKQ